MLFKDIYFLMTQCIPDQHCSQSSCSVVNECFEKLVKLIVVALMKLLRLSKVFKLQNRSSDKREIKQLKDWFR